MPRTGATISKAVDAYLAKHELPSDPVVLEKMLHHRDIERQRAVLVKLEQVIPEERPKRTRALIGQLKLLRDTAEDDEIEELTTRLLDLLD